MTASVEPELPTTSVAFESVGVACARATFAALVVGVVEGLVAGSRVGTTSISLAIANAALWLPAALVALLPAGQIARALERDRALRRPWILAGLGALGFAVVFAIVFASRGGWALAPAEIVGVVGFATLASSMRFEGGARRVIAFLGLALVVFLQLFAHRWIDAHRALTGALVDHTAFPRFMLRNVLRRYS